jgi:hypothetical protein
MIQQRACVAESQVYPRLSNGPLRAQSKADFIFCLVFCDVRAYVSSREYDCILIRVAKKSQSKVAPRNEYIRP